MNKLFLLATGALGAVLAGCQDPALEADLLIANVQIVDAEAKSIIENQDIWIADDRILHISSHGEVRGKAETTLNGDGAFAVAGLYDAHTHIDTSARLALMLPEIFGETITANEIDEDIAAHIAFGVTGIVVLGGNEDTLAARERAKARGAFAPRIITAGPILDGPQSQSPTALKITSPEAGIAAVEDAATKGYDLIKVYHIGDVGTRNAIIGKAGELGLPVAGHIPPGMDFEDAIVPGFQNVAHAEEITRFWDGEDQSYLTSAVSLMAEHNVSFTPHLLGYREIAEEITDIDAKLASLDWALTPPLARVYATPPFNGYVNDFGAVERRDRFAAYFNRIADAMEGLTLEAHEAGVLVLAGTDTGNPTMEAGQGLLREMSLLKGAGLDGYDVLAAATINPAKLFGEAEERGSIDEGKVADIVIFSVNPVEENLLSRSQIKAVIKDGYLFDRARLDEEAARLSAAYDARENRYLAAAHENYQPDPE